MTGFCVFFFQAEDGIRDLVRSRGLGDVYKRQHHDRRLLLLAALGIEIGMRDGGAAREGERTGEEEEAVSYTHLTLPTSDLV